MFVYPFERLEAWSLAIDLTAAIYDQTKNFPTKEMYGLTIQIRRAAISVSSNLAEGSGRISKKDQAHFFSMSYSSLLEVLNQFIIAHRIGYITDIDLQSIRGLIEKLSKKIAALRNATLNLIQKTNKNLIPLHSTLYPLQMVLST